MRYCTANMIFLYFGIAIAIIILCYIIVEKCCEAVDARKAAKHNEEETKTDGMENIVYTPDYSEPMSDILERVEEKYPDFQYKAEERLKDDEE